MLELFVRIGGSTVLDVQNLVFIDDVVRNGSLVSCLHHFVRMEVVMVDVVHLLLVVILGLFLKSNSLGEKGIGFIEDHNFRLSLFVLFG